MSFPTTTGRGYFVRPAAATQPTPVVLVGDDAGGHGAPLLDLEGVQGRLSTEEVGDGETERVPG